MKIRRMEAVDVNGKRVFLRADLNVPLDNGRIVQDFRLHKILPTIDYILTNGAKVILATHIGRPKAKIITNFFDKTLSTKNLQSWFEQRGYKIKYEPDLLKAEELSHKNFDQILLLENLRFFNGEKGEEEEREKLAKLLKNLSDLYVNDAFSIVHRNDTSVTLLPKKFEIQNLAFGFLIEKEIEELSKLKENVKQPFILVLGGNKIKSKIRLLENFLNIDERNRPRSILIGGAIAYTFLKTQGISVGRSIVENEYLKFAKNFLNEAKKKDIEILLPVDHLATDGEIKNINKNSTKYYDSSNLSKNCIGIDIGQKTTEIFEKVINEAKMIFVNGSMGIYYHQASQKGTKEILNSIANSNAYKIAGGGDCVAACYNFNLQEKFDFLSTGGGATLAFLGLNESLSKLPGLNAFF